MVAIEFENIGKLYRLGQIGTGSLQHDLQRWWKTKILRQEDPYLKIGETNDRTVRGTSDYVWALKDINLKIEQGDVVGIIGKNGAGKSTLLKLLSRVTAPTTGTIRARGRIASLLEVGTGFHTELTGRENVYLNGAIMGMTRHEITSKLDDIVDFSGVTRYIDTPVKRYSSGMMVRLGFAVAAFLEPEILVVDEVLAVGDADFQKKAIGKMQDVSKGQGRTVLFVSHNMGSMQRLCNNGVLLENGMVSFTGNILDTIRQYQNGDVRQVSFDGIDGDPDTLSISNIHLTTDFGNVYYNSKAIRLGFQVKVAKEIANLVVGFNIMSQFNYPLARADYNDANQLDTLSPGTYEFLFEIPPYTLSEGNYTVVFDVAIKGVKNFATEKSNITFTVVPGEDCFGNKFSETIPTKISIVRQKWLKEMSLKKLADEQ